MDKMVEDTIVGELYLQRGVKLRYGKEVSVINDKLPCEGDYYIDRNGAADIYQLCGYDMNGFKMNQYDIHGNVVFELDDISLDELNERFIKLSDYLKDALFVGRQFRRTQPVCIRSEYNLVDDSVLNSFHGIHFSTANKREYINAVDSSYVGIDSYSKTIVLYAKDNIFLAKYTGRFGNVYQIIDCSYIIDGNYEFYGEVHEEYRDKDKVYNEFLEQILGSDKIVDKVKQRTRKK